MKMKVIKRDKTREPYTEEKVFNSCHRACLNAHLKEEKAQNFCKHVLVKVNVWATSKEEITSKEIFEKIAEELKKHDADAFLMYKTHRDIS